MFTEVTAFYQDCAFRDIRPPRPGPPALRGRSPAEKAEEALWHDRRFQAFRMIHKIRDFRSVLCADVRDVVGKYSAGVLKSAVAAQKARRGFDSTFPEPLVIYSSRASSSIAPRIKLGPVPQ